MWDYISCFFDKNENERVLKMFSVSVVKLDPGAKLPSYGSEGAAGADLYACLEHPVVISPGATEWIPTGVSVEIPSGYVGLVCARSGLACKYGLAPANKVGVIDSDYRGPLLVVLHNHGTEEQTVHHGDRIAQLLITPVAAPSFVWSDELSSTERGSNGFGSTGN